MAHLVSSGELRGSFLCDTSLQLVLKQHTGIRRLCHRYHSDGAERTLWVDGTSGEKSVFEVRRGGQPSTSGPPVDILFKVRHCPKTLTSTESDFLMNAAR